MTCSPSPSPSPNPRKRPRSETTSEERKEARAHRNRIAAQNSRDRRKAQFAYLEHRVAELEEENRALRAQHSVPLPASARDRENEELRERIKTLERGWDAVIRALAVHGLPLTAPPPPVDPKPSPDTLESTRHLARVASIGPSPMALQRPDDAAMEDLFLEILASPFPADPANPNPAAATAPRSAAQTAGSVQAPAEEGPDAASLSAVVMEELEVGLGLDPSGDAGAESTMVDMGSITTTPSEQQEAWDNGLEMQRILASLGVVGESQPTELEIELGWTTFGVESTGVGVF